MIGIKNNSEISLMSEACRVVKDTLFLLEKYIKPGVATIELDSIAEDYIMNQKDVWLQTTGTIDGPFSFKWFDKIEPKKIVDVELVKNKDIEFIFKLEDNTSFTGIMRWGKGCGFSCFRIDFK